MKNIKLFMAACAVFTGLGGMVPATVLAASPKDTVCQTLGSNSNCTSSPGNGVNINRLIAAVVNILSIVVGVAAVIMIIIGGFRYVTSNGDSNNVSSAKNTIIYALIGLIVVAFAQVIVQFVLNRVR